MLVKSAYCGGRCHSWRQSDTNLGRNGKSEVQRSTWDMNYQVPVTWGLERACHLPIRLRRASGTRPREEARNRRNISPRNWWTLGVTGHTDAEASSFLLPDCSGKNYTSQNMNRQGTNQLEGDLVRVSEKSLNFSVYYTSKDLSIQYVEEMSFFITDSCGQVFGSACWSVRVIPEAPQWIGASSQALLKTKRCRSTGMRQQVLYCRSAKCQVRGCCVPKRFSGKVADFDH